MSRAALLALSVLAVLGAVLLPAAGRAAAAVPDQWGFAYLDNPTPPPGYAPDPSRQWGSWPSPGSNLVTVDQTGLGTYTVHFPQIAGKNGIAHSTAVTATGDSCQISGWSPNGANEDVGVSCFSPTGTPDNSEFTVLYTTSSGTLPAGATGYGYVYSDTSGSLLASYNSAGGGNSVSKGGTGQWKVWLPGLGAASAVGNLQVTAVDPQQDAHCKPVAWTPAATGQTVTVACTDANGKPYDTRWTLSYAVQRAVHGPAFPPKSFAYLWYDGAVPAGTTYNSSGAGNGLATSGTGWVLTLPNVATPSDHAQATAYGNDTGYCGFAAPWTRSGSTALLDVTCYLPGGAPAPKEQFFAAYTSAV
ncbi:hypothetical protein [Actinacidiphila yeochonensis]|uniref:hypothetical protein n=1 Tax=Actinacidiphila yeochonensis TaxID=89050 RepID=UPI000AC19A61|nr:hypothetical protein [Actinacidiphila yeochonensis]